MRWELARFEPFQELNRPEIELIGRHARRLALPGDRWLLRPGRSLQGHHFLLSGTVATLNPSRVISAHQAVARRALYPGVAGLRTLSDSVIVRVPDSVMDLLTHRETDELIVVGEPEDCWQARFLGSALMSALSPGVWQGVLNRMQPQVVAARECIVQEQSPESGHCYVLADGLARVERQGLRLALLEPGELFGEDALITSEPRNASIVMQTDGVVMRLDASDFRRFLLEVLSAGVYRAPERGPEGTARELLRLRSSCDLRTRIARLNPSIEYLVSSSRPEVESLAIFLMQKAGLVAWAAPRL